MGRVGLWDEFACDALLTVAIARFLGFGCLRGADFQVFETRRISFRAG